MPTRDCRSRADLKHDLIEQQAITWTYSSRQKIISSRSMFVISALFVLFFVLPTVQSCRHFKTQQFQFSGFSRRWVFLRATPGASIRSKFILIITSSTAICQKLYWRRSEHRVEMKSMEISIRTCGGLALCFSFISELIQRFVRAKKKITKKRKEREMNNASKRVICEMKKRRLDSL